MRKIENYESVNEAGENKRIVPGAYPVRITDVVDVPEKECLEVYFDIAEGEFKGYYADAKSRTGTDYSRYFRSYKEKALPFFKRFVTAVEKSNPGYSWDWNEKSLIGKYAVAVYGEEEYVDKENNVAVNVRVQEFRSLQALRAGEIKIPELKKLPDGERPVKAAASPTPSTSIDDDKLPF